ncbi:hypothetical protein AB0J35_54460 [Nonomuraea angiospora]|uniref:hypothetical protein n=1 Tax=Nonomuraea angiospora TaxID=46172 RepID=UPI00342B8925
MEGIVPAELVELMYRADSTKRQRILRTVYECGIFQTLREKLRCKEIWVVGADRWRDPDDDLPRFAEFGVVLGPPPQAFVDQLRGEMDAELSALKAPRSGPRNQPQSNPL